MCDSAGGTGGETAEQAIRNSLSGEPQSHEPTEELSGQSLPSRVDGSPGSPRESTAARGEPSMRERALLSALVTIVALFFLFSPWPLLEKLKTIGHACCAQIASHTIRFDGQPMPIDARNTGIYTGVFMVVAIVWLTGRRKAALFAPLAIRGVLMLIVTAMVFDGFNSVAQTYHLRTFYSDSNALRIVTGTFSGIALTILTLPLFNRLTWHEPDQIAIVEDFTDLAGYLAGAVIVVALLLQAPPLLYYPMSIISIAGLLITLTFVNTCVCLVSLRRENQVRSLGAFVLPALAGLVLTCLEIAAINYWHGLHH